MNYIIAGKMIIYERSNEFSSFSLIAELTVFRKRLTYASSGVSIATGNEFVRAISPLTKLTARTGCLSSIGGFGGLFDAGLAGYNKPLLVARTDGVGTKLMVCTFLFFALTLII